MQKIIKCTCAECGKTFKAVERANTRKYCSTKCGKRASNRGEREAQKRRDAGIELNIVKKCAQCGKEFIVHTRRFQKYCSKKCQITANSESSRLYKQRKQEESLKQPKKRRKAKLTSVDDVMRYCRQHGITYQDFQKAETLAMTESVKERIEKYNWMKEYLEDAQ